MNAVIASSFFYYPFNKIEFAMAKEITNHIYKYIRQRDYKTYISTFPQNYDIFHAARNLGFTVHGKPLDRNLGAKAYINLDESLNSTTQLSLAFYGNQLTVSLANESIIAQVISTELGLRDVISSVKQADGNKLTFIPNQAPVDLIMDRVKFLRSLFSNEFITFNEESEFQMQNLEELMNYTDLNKIAKLDQETGLI